MDGTIVRIGELKEPRAMIEQVKGFSYSVSSLLGANLSLPTKAEEDMHEEWTGQQSIQKDQNKKSWWRISLAYPKVWDPRPTR